MSNEISVVSRRLLKAPGFVATALAALALCIGASLALFAVVGAVLLRPLPCPRADGLLAVYFTYPNIPAVAVPMRRPGPQESIRGWPCAATETAQCLGNAQKTG
jgi:hypothetical protein